MEVRVEKVYNKILLQKCSLKDRVQHIVPMPLQFTILEYMRSIKITTDSNCNSWTVQIKLISKRCITPDKTKWSATEASVSRAIRNNTGNLSLNGCPLHHESCQNFIQVPSTHLKTNEANKFIPSCPYVLPNTYPIHSCNPHLNTNPPTYCQNLVHTTLHHNASLLSKSPKPFSPIKPYWNQLSLWYPAATLR